jgi:histidinol-phosphate aminotransferase
MTSLSRRAWLHRSALAAAALPLSRLYQPDHQSFENRPEEENEYIRLNSNENAYGPSDAARRAVLDSLADANRYPRHYYSKLISQIADRENVTPDHVMITAGSSEILGLVGLTYGIEGGDVLGCHPTFDFTMRYAEHLGCIWTRTPLTQNYQYNLAGLAGEAGPNTRLVFICNPNNPTGTEIPYSALRAFCLDQSRRHPVFIDEAYIEFSSNGRNNSMVDLAAEHQNIVIARTFSKIHGLAGLRIGYALAHPSTIALLKRYHSGRNVTVSNAAAAAASACLDDPEFENFCYKKIVEGRGLVCLAFDNWGVDYMGSSASFVCFKNDKFTMKPREAMEKENILIRDYSEFPGWSRVSIGTVPEMKTFIEAATKYIG